MSRAFTLIELLTVTFIILVLSALILPNWRAGQPQFALDRAGSQLAQDIRRVQGMALGALEVEDSLGNIRVAQGYGLHADLATDSSYFIYAAFGASLDWQDGDPDFVKVETIDIERGVRISGLGGELGISVVFVPPMPSVQIFPGSPAVIELSIESGARSTVCVNRLGLIELAETCP